MRVCFVHRACSGTPCASPGRRCLSQSCALVETRLVRFQWGLTSLRGLRTSQVGELFIATIAKSGGEMRSPQVKAAQKEREQGLAVQLIALLKRYVYGDEEGFLVRASTLI